MKQITQGVPLPRPSPLFVQSGLPLIVPDLHTATNFYCCVFGCIAVEPACAETGNQSLWLPAARISLVLIERSPQDPCASLPPGTLSLFLDELNEVDLLSRVDQAGGSILGMTMCHAGRPRVLLQDPFGRRIFAELRITNWERR